MFSYLAISVVLVLLFGFNSFFFIPGEIRKFKEFIKDKKFDEAMKVFKQSLESRRNLPEIVYGLAQIYEHRNDWYLVVFEYARLLRDGKYPPELDEVQVRLKRIHANKILKNFDDVIEDSYAILSILPDNYQANFEMGKRFYNMKNYRAARPYLEKINSNDDQKILGFLLDIEINEKQYDKAMEYIHSLESLHGEAVPAEVMFKKIIIHYYLKDFNAILEVREAINPDERVPLDIEVIVAIALMKMNRDVEEAQTIFKKHLEGFLDNHSEYVVEGRYMYSEILAQKGLFSNAYIQNRFIQQVNPHYRDVVRRGEVLFAVIQNPSVQELLQKEDMEALAGEVVKFKFSDFFFIESRIVFNGDEYSNAKWIALGVSTGVDKVFHLIVCVNMKPMREADIQNMLDIISKKTESNLGALNCVFLSLFGLAPESESIIVQNFKDCIFCTQGEFINCFKNKKIPVFPD